jgi:hypothetical protein
MHYLKYRWDELRGDEHADWGGSWWYFEVGTDGYPRRQIEQYDNGVVLRYGPERPEDDFGSLSSSGVADWDRSADQEIAAQDFEAVWKAAELANGGRHVTCEPLSRVDVRRGRDA